MKDSIYEINFEVYFLSRKLTDFYISILNSLSIYLLPITKKYEEINKFRIFTFTFLN